MAAKGLDWKVNIPSDGKYFQLLRPGDQQGRPAPGRRPPVAGVPLQRRGPEPLPEGLRPPGAAARHEGRRHASDKAAGPKPAQGGRHAHLPRPTEQVNTAKEVLAGGWGAASRDRPERSCQAAAVRVQGLARRPAPARLRTPSSSASPRSRLLVGAFTSRGRRSSAGQHAPEPAGRLPHRPRSAASSCRPWWRCSGAVLGTFLAQAVVTSRFAALRESVLTASGVLANFGGVPLAFAWIATLGNSGVSPGRSGSPHAAGPVHLLGPGPGLPVLLGPADGARRGRPRWTGCGRSGGRRRPTTAPPPGSTGVTSACPVLTPALLGGVVLLFGGAFAAYATAAGHGRHHRPAGHAARSRTR